MLQYKCLGNSDFVNSDTKWPDPKTLDFSDNYPMHTAFQQMQKFLDKKDQNKSADILQEKILRHAYFEKVLFLNVNYYVMFHALFFF